LGHFPATLYKQFCVKVAPCADMYTCAKICVQVVLCADMHTFHICTHLLAQQHHRVDITSRLQVLKHSSARVNTNNACIYLVRECVHIYHFAQRHCRADIMSRLQGPYRLEFVSEYIQCMYTSSSRGFVHVYIEFVRYICTLI